MEDTALQRLMMQVNRNDFDIFVINLIYSIFGSIHLAFIAMLFIGHLICVICSLDLTISSSYQIFLDLSAYYLCNMMLNRRTTSNDRIINLIARVFINIFVTSIWLHFVYSLTLNIYLFLSITLFLAILQVGIDYFSIQFESNSDFKSLSWLITFEICLVASLLQLSFRNDSMGAWLICSRLAPHSILQGMKAMVTHEISFFYVTVVPSHSMNLCFDISCVFFCFSTSIFLVFTFSSSRTIMSAVAIHDLVSMLKPMFSLIQTWFCHVNRLNILFAQLIY